MFLCYHSYRTSLLGLDAGGWGGAYRHCCVPSTCNAYPLLYRLVYDKVHLTSRRINSPFAPWPALLDVTSDKSATETSNSKIPPIHHLHPQNNDEQSSQLSWLILSSPYLNWRLVCGRPSPRIVFSPQMLRPPRNPRGRCLTLKPPSQRWYQNKLQQQQKSIQSIENFPHQNSGYCLHAAVRHSV